MTQASRSVEIQVNAAADLCYIGYRDLEWTEGENLTKRAWGSYPIVGQRHNLDASVSRSD